MKYKRLSKILLMTLLMLMVIFSSKVSNATEVDPNTVAEEGVASGATDDDLLSVGLTLNNNTDEGTLSGTLQMLLVLTVISLAPSILVMVTSFTRVVIVLHFVRNAIGTTTTPPNNVLIGLSLFLTLFIMSPVFAQIKEKGMDPYTNGQITQEEAIDNCIEPLRGFMLNQVRETDLKLFMDIAGIEPVKTLDEIPTTVVVPAFIISELRAAFIIGFLIYIPFIVIDMVVSSTLMAMGMMMLPPTTISMPFKILLFILADGWNLVIGQVVKSFNL